MVNKPLQNCDDLYIGETGRPFGNSAEHKKCIDGADVKSVLSMYEAETDHMVTIQPLIHNVTVTDKDAGLKLGKVPEALHIKKTQ